MLGEKIFAQKAYAYIDAYPSRHFSVRHFGQYFSQFLKSDSTDKPMLTEMAIFEWAISESQEAAEAQVLTVDAMSKIDPQI